VVAGGALAAQFKTAVVEIYGNGSQYNWDSGAYYPSTDNARNLGGTSNRWAAVYAANGTIQTSDRTRKHDISGDTLGLDFVQRLRPVSFVMNDESDEVRRHGLIAQEVIEAAQGASLAGILSGWQFVAKWSVGTLGSAALGRPASWRVLTSSMMSWGRWDTRR